MVIGQLFEVKRIMSGHQHVLNWRQELFGQDYRVSTFSALYLTLSEITKQSLILWYAWISDNSYPLHTYRLYLIAKSGA